MIRFLSPGFAWALAMPALILVLYLLRRRYLPQRVPSVFLWRRSIRDYAANRPIQRLMKNLLLPLQLLAAAALALALMHPVIPGGTAGRSILIFDISGSMQTETGGRTRLDTAKEKALALIANLPAEERITVLTAGDEAERVALSAGRDEAEQAIASIACGRGGADLNKALALAEAIAGEKESGAEVTVFSDAFRPAEATLRGAETALRVINVGEAEENRAVYSLTAENGRAYARIANFGGACRVSLTCEADGVLCDARETEIPAGGTAGISFEIPAGAEAVRVRLREKDALRADDEAETAVKRNAARSVAVSSDSVFLESALRVRPELTVIRTGEKALSPAGEDASLQADLYIIGSSPLIFTTKLPEGGYDPSANRFGVFSWAEEDLSPDSSAGEEASLQITECPLTAGVTMKNVFFRGIRPISGGRTAVSAAGEAMIAYTEDTVVFGFDLHDSNLPLKYDFPVLIQNVLDWLTEKDPKAETGAAQFLTEPMPIGESDTRDTAPDYGTEQAAAHDGEQGRDLTGILLAAALLLLLAEMGVSRYVG